MESIEPLTPSRELFENPGRHLTFPGTQVAGIVKVLDSPDEASKVCEGDIAVIHYARPHYIKVVSKCVAVVSDVGGPACSLGQCLIGEGIPGLFGTGNATEVLRDGDILEMVFLDHEDGALIGVERRELSERKDFESTGRKVGKGTVMGRVKIISSPSEGNRVDPGDILVVKDALAEYVSILERCAAIICDEGSASGHLAIVCRHMGKLGWFGTGNATEVLQDGMLFTVRN